MDLTIQRQPNSLSRLATYLYDKREHEPLSNLFIIKFPHASSQISDTAKYGIITSQFHRLRRIITMGDDFAERMGEIVDYMGTKGHDVGRMLGQVSSLCKRSPELYGLCPSHTIKAIRKAFFDLAAVTQ